MFAARASESDACSEKASQGKISATPPPRRNVTVPLSSSRPIRGGALQATWVVAGLAMQSCKWQSGDEADDSTRRGNGGTRGPVSSSARAKGGRRDRRKKRRGPTQSRPRTAGLFINPPPPLDSSPHSSHAQQQAPEAEQGKGAERHQPSDPSLKADPMALALSGSSARAVLAALAPRASSAATRGYAASAASGAMRRAAAAAEGAAAGEAKEAGRAAEISWVPDPVTGHYRPANWAAAADPADLRAAHLARSYARA
ncbi:hypothetical protein BAE44_0014593 [Dichanthelium oligosanthes]|uniref:Uncharacterized protein n=1 Tax=Dichanthelium oligosanthes TaxID=888268 RepID=A0A1E5VGW9_9POAL|nr:hypothetical protein BAE44_0014593 [Dichanthelium oligosanthes]